MATALWLLVAAVAVRMPYVRGQTFSLNSLDIQPREPKVPVEMSVSFQITVALSAGAKIRFAMGGVTNGNADATDGSSTSTVHMSHSTYFTTRWTEGTFARANPYGGSHLELTLTRAIAANELVTLKVDRQNGFRLQCGQSRDEGRFRTTVTDHTGAVILHSVAMSHPPFGDACRGLGFCHGHGACDACANVCRCDEGWGSRTADTLDRYVRIDCAERVCPKGRAWAAVPTDASAHATELECSSNGICDRAEGLCECFAGYEGEACQRQACPNGCSGHGQCLPMSELSANAAALPLSHGAGYGTGSAKDSGAWEAELMAACVCDSSWPVGLAAGETQQAEYFGADCSLRRCPTGDDPSTAADETDCASKAAAGGRGAGAPGNLCHVDCSNRGRCDRATGTCACFHGFTGENCGALAPWMRPDGT